MNTLGFLTSAALLAMSAPQEPPAASLDSLIRIALEENPAIVAAQQRVRAAEARVPPAGARPDPVLTFSVMNFPVSEPGFGDFMTMKSLGLSQRLPYPGKLALAEQATRFEVSGAEAALDDLSLHIIRDVRQAYYDLAFIDRSLGVVERHTGVLAALVGVAAARYGVGTVGQEDVLQAQVETAALADEAARLTERRRAVVAARNRLLNRPPTAPMTGVALPEQITSVAASPGVSVGFVSLDPGARAAESPLRTLDELLRAGVANSPMIRGHVSRIDSQRVRLDLSRKAHLPDFDIALSYGQRNDRADMVSLSVAFPLPVGRGARQDSWAAEAQAELSALQAEHSDHVNLLGARIAEVYSDLERHRSGLALLTTGMVPQGSAALQAATAGFSVGRTDFQTVLATQTALFRYEIAVDQALTDFAKKLAEMEALVGEEALR
jgi:cobalt-zinc-cadmium efflux system outer membrane protein